MRLDGVPARFLHTRQNHSPTGGDAVGLAPEEAYQPSQLP